MRMLVEQADRDADSAFSSWGFLASPPIISLRREERTMTPEETDKAVQFITDHQAQASADLQTLAETQSRLTDATASNTRMIDRVADILEKMADTYAKLAQSQSVTDQRVAELR